jgi:hypothetical protein
MPVRMMKHASVAGLVAAISLWLATASPAQLSDTFTNWIEHPAIAYRTRPLADPVARLNRELRDGRVQLKFEGPSGYLGSALSALNIPVESQVALFSQDSLQRQLINSTNPRAIFFNDTVSVAWVNGGFIEVASQDPRQGIVFYALDNDPVARPQFVRRQDCLSCHYSYSTSGVPGMLDRSYAQFKVDHSIPLEQRWGGWFVTGQPNAVRHQGNRVVTTGERSPASATWPSMAVKFDASPYPSAQSDIVALLAFDHQMKGMNLIARIGWEARVAEFAAQNGGSAAALPQGVADDAPIPLADAAREVVDYFLFVDEAPFPAPVRGASGFAEWFERQGRRDRVGRSLRALDLDTRLLRYPCSWLIYTDAFEALLPEAKAAVYTRLWQVLSGDARDPKYQRLSPADRRAIIEILRDTKEGLPGYFAAG